MQIPYGKHFIDKDDIKNVSKVLKTQSITQGPLINKFEKAICKLLKVKYAVAVSSAQLDYTLQSKQLKKFSSSYLPNIICINC